MKHPDRMSSSLGRRTGRSHLLALEPRMMFDAAVAATTEAVAAAGAPVDRAPVDRAALTTDSQPAREPAPLEAFAPSSIEYAPIASPDRFADRAMPESTASSPRASARLDAFDGAASDRDSARVPVEASRDLSGATATEPTTASHAIVFIDTAVDDYRQLAAEWATQAQVVLIDGTRDGIDQVRAALAGRSDISAIHIVSHGAEGVFWLGTTRVDQAAIDGDLASSLAAIGRSLEPGGDILIYGCDFAEGDAGATALASFARATGADVAASTDITGLAARGGDWVLEAHSGAIEARTLDGGDWAHTLDPNTPVPISVTADSLTVTNGAGTVVVSGSTGYGSDARSPDVGVGSVARWVGASTFNGQSVDLIATVVSLSAGDAIRFNRPTGTGANGDDPTFLLRDLTTGASDATVQITWSLVVSGTNTALPADVRFTISDIDGIGGNANTRESVSTSTDGLAYFTRERVSDIAFTSSLNAVTASGTQNENTDTTQPITSKSAATFDWSKVSSFTLNYKLTTNAVATQAQFYQDGDADFLYSDPVYVSIPRLDLDADDSTATGNDAHFTFTENGPGVPVVDGDVAVTNPMGVDAIIGASVTLTNYQAGDVLSVGTLPANISATVNPVSNGRIVVTLSGNGSESDYDAALKAIRYSNTSDTPDTTQRILTVSFSNDTLTSAVATSRIDVVPVNDAPTAVDDSATTAEDTAVTIAVLANDTDPEGDALTVTSASALHGSVVRNANGTLTYTPNANYNGTDTISYAISDGHGGTSSATVAVTITPVNDAPAPVGSLPNRASTDGATVSYATAAGFADVDGDTLTYSATGLPTGLTIGATTGVISGTIDRSASQVGGGSYAVVVTARDPSGASTTQGFTLTATNPPPSAVNDSATTAEDTAVTIAVLANDTDPDGDPLTVTSASALHGSVVRNANGTLTYTPNANYNGTDTISYAISDGQGGTSNATVAVTITPVNDAPTRVGSLPDRSGTDGAAVSYATAAGFADVDGDALTYSATGLPTGLTIGATTGVISGTIDRSASQVGGGSYAVVVTARDPSGASATQGFQLSVANPPPVADDDAVTTHVDRGVTIPVLANDSDPDGDPIGVVAASAARGTVAILGDGTLRYTPPAGYVGSDTIVYTISDGQGGTSTATVAVTIGNSAPTPGTGGDRAALDGQTVSLPIGASFSDADGDTLSFTATGLPAGLTIDPATGLISGTIDHAASGTNGGIYDTIVTADDGHGGTGSATVHWTITNPAPIARDDSAGGSEDGVIVIAPLANDSDPDGDPLTLVSAVAGHGSVTINADGTIAYRPTADFNGTDTIVYTIADSDGGRASASITVTVAPVADAPTTTGLPARSDTDGEAISIPAAAAFADADGDALTYTATGLPAGLTIDPATGAISGTIAPGGVYGGTDGQGHYAVVVTATDPSGRSVQAPFAWSVLAAGPVARSDSATTVEDMPVTVAVLANDSDPDGDPLTLVEVVGSHGTAAIVGNALVFTPDAGFNGVAMVTYMVADPAGNRSSATVTITVTPVNDAPVAQPLAAHAGSDGQAVMLDVGGFFADPDGDALRFAATGLPAGLAIDATTGRISGVVDRSASQTPGGTYHVVVTATDPSGATASSGFDWAISNPAPIAADDAATTAEDASIRIPVLANDADPDGDPLTVVAASAAHGRVTIDPDGSLSYTPDADFNGDDVIVYTISDGQGGTASASVLVTITPVNDAPIAIGSLPDRAANDGAVVSIPTAIGFADADEDLLGYSATGLPAGLAIDAATGVITGTVDHSASQVAGGTYAVVVTARDPSGATATQAFTLTTGNPAPIALDDAARTTADVAVMIPVLANDGDPDGDPIAVTGAIAAHGTVVVGANGTLAYTPGPGFTGIDTIRYTIVDGDGATATALVTVTVDPPNHAPVTPADGVPVDAVGGRPTRIAPLDGVTDPDGDPVTLTGATAASGRVVVNADGTLTFTPALGFVGTTTITYAVADGRGGVATGTILVRVADGGGADIQQLLDFGRPHFVDPTPLMATVRLRDGEVRNPLSVLNTVDGIRSLNATSIGDHPVGDAVEAIRSLRGTDIDPDAPILAEVARLDRLRDQRDAGDRLFDHRWGDFMVRGLTGFSAAADGNACIMLESVVRDGAIYIEVRDTAEGAHPAIRAVDVRLADGRAADWIHVDRRGLAIVERGADMDELHLVVRVTRDNGRTTSTPIVVQGQTGEIEIDRRAAPATHHRPAYHRHPAAPLDATLHTPGAAAHADAARLSNTFR